MKFEAFIFDVDGTLWDSVDVCVMSWNNAISEHSNYPPVVTREQLKCLFGKPMKEIFEAVFPGIPEEEQIRLAKYCEEYENRMLKEIPGTPYPGVADTIRELSKKADLYIVSNCQSGYIELCMEGLGIGEYIKDYACYGDNKVSKGENIRLLMERNGLENVVYVGDTQGDANACKEAGIPMIFAAYGFGEVENIEYQISNFTELLSFVLS